jgi:hypothetical protein
MALAAASLRMVTLSTLDISKSKIRVIPVSNPSRINRGRFGSFSNILRRSPPPSPPRLNDEVPLNSILGILFGSDPNSRLSKVPSEGSRLRRLSKTFEVPAANNSSAIIIRAEPVKLSPGRSKRPVMTTASKATNDCFSLTLIGLLISAVRVSVS